MALVLGRRTENAFLFGIAAGGVAVAALGLSAARFVDLAVAKYAVAALILGLFLIAPCPLCSQERLLLAVGLLFFPVTLAVGGKDALTTGSLVILLLGGCYVLRFLFSRPGVYRVDKGVWVSLLIVIAAAGVWRAPRSFLGPEVRHFVNFLSSAVLFLLLINAPRFVGANRVALAWSLTTLMIWMTLIQTFIGIAIYYVPRAGELFAVFLTRVEEGLTATETLEYVRMRSLVVNTESVGEISAMLCPFVLYRVFEGSRKYWIVYAVMAAGLLLSNTRSGILLFGALSILMLSLYGPRLRWPEVVVLAVGVPVVLAIVIARRPEFVEDVASRLLIVWKTLRAGGNFVEIMQRELVWYDAWDVTLSTLSLFGHGPAPSRVLGLNELNMHCLYMTLVFQFGLAGAALYLGLFLYILYRLLVLRRRTLARLRNLRIVCVMSLVCFLVNEVKFEFNRGDSYQQIIWAMMAVYYLIARASRDEFVQYARREQGAPAGPAPAAEAPAGESVTP